MLLVTFAFEVIEESIRTSGPDPAETFPGPQLANIKRKPTFTPSFSFDNKTSREPGHKATWKPNPHFALTHYVQNVTSPPCPPATEACVLNSGREPIEEFELPKYSCLRIHQCVSVTIKTRHRYNLVKRLIESIHRLYPKLKIIVQDELNPENMTSYRNWLAYLKSNHMITFSQSEPGVGLGRRHAVAIATTKYVLVLDDDFVFSRQTNLEKLFTVIQQSDVDIVGGRTGDKYHFQGMIRTVLQPHQSASGSSNRRPEVQLLQEVFHDIMPSFKNCYAADYTKNFFLADRDAILNAGSWDSSRQFFEHEDFFMQMRKEQIKVAYCDDVIVMHVRSDSRLEALRIKAKPAMFRQLRAKWNVSDIRWCRNNPSKYLTSYEC